MKKLLALLFAIGSMSAQAEVNIKHDEFLFHLEGDWTQSPGKDPEQFTFESASKKTSVVLSLMAPLNISKDKLTEVAKKFAEVREQAEHAARPNEKLEFGDKWVELQPSGDLVEVAYAGHDGRTIFRLFGFVTQHKVLSLWVATTTNDNDFSKKVFDEVYRALKFYVP